MGFEFTILDWMQTWHTPWLDSWMIWITRLGNAGRLWILLCVLLIPIKKTRKAGIAMALALLIDLILCNGLLKNIVARPRPCWINDQISLLIASPKDYSFPSGHTAVSFAAVGALYFSKQKYLWRASLAVAILIAVSRMYLYVHFPTDILGGIVVGMLSGWLGAMAVNRITKRTNRRIKR